MFSLIFVAVGGAVCQAIRGEDFWSFLLCAGTSGFKFNSEQAREAMEIDWMTRRELSQAVPPAYTTFIGFQLKRMLS